MPEHVIKSVQGPRTWTGKYGEMHTYDVVFDGIDGKVEISQKPTTPAPKVGDSLAGMVEEQNGFKKFKKEQKASFGGGGGGGFRANPEDMRQRAAQGALSNAVAWAAHRDVRTGSEAATPYTDVLKLADAFYGFIRNKAEGK